ncbi:MAG: alpha/beta hydrolase [Pseudomonadota bacterium]
MTTRSILGAAAVLILTACGAIFLWAKLPVRVFVHEADPSLSLINAQLDLGAASFTGHYIDYGGHRLHYVQAGDHNTEAVVFVHGFPSYWFSFVHQLTDFSADYHVLAVDGLGAGRSDAPASPEPYRLESMATHLLALLDDLGKDRVHFVGHDWGAALALGFAQRYPDRVLSVTGISAPPQNVLLEVLNKRSGDGASFDYIETLKRANPVLLMVLGFRERIWRGAYAPLVAEGALSEPEGELFRDATSNPKRVNAHINWYRANVPAPDNIQADSFWPARGARIAAPMLFIWGQEDELISPGLVSQLVYIADSAELLPLDDIGHWPHIQRPDAVNNAIRTLLSLASVRATQQ